MVWLQGLYRNVVTDMWAPIVILLLRSELHDTLQINLNKGCYSHSNEFIARMLAMVQLAPEIPQPDVPSKLILMVINGIGTMLNLSQMVSVNLIKIGEHEKMRMIGEEVKK